MQAPDLKTIKKTIKKFVPILREAREANKNEADTLMIITEFLKEGLGYDPFKEITREFQVRDKYCDVALKIDGQVKVLLEAKDVATTLQDKHIEQAESYASRSGVQWVILTNAVNWNLYHLNFNESEGIDRVRVLSLDLFAEGVDEDSVANQFANIHRDNVAAGELDVLWQKFSALSSKGLVRSLFSESVISLLRREIRRETGILIPLDDILLALKGLLDKSILAELADIRIRKRRRRRRGHVERPGASESQDEGVDVNEPEDEEDIEEEPPVKTE